MSSLHTFFNQLLTHYQVNQQVIINLWQEIEERHSEPHRFYHNLSHLSNLLFLLQEIHNRLESPDGIYLAVFFHDIIYDPSSNINEKQSAHLAKRRLESGNLPQNLIDICVKTILATKSHKPDISLDINYFTDADLGILGTSWPVYLEYSKKIRKEYLIYNDETYINGRKKVLEYFLEMPRIYKTNYFYNKLERNSRTNLQKELSNL